MSEELRIIIVDDHEITRVGLQVGLERSGDVVVVGQAETGREAVAIAHELQPDVVLMDIGLPELNGIEATAEIKHRCQSMKVLILTSRDSNSDVQSAFAAGADGYCLKDVPASMLRLAIRSIAVGAVWLDSRVARGVIGRDRSPDAGQHLETSGGARTGQIIRPPGSEMEMELTARELEVLDLVTQGLSNNQIASRLYVSSQTVKSHVRNIMDKLSVSDRTQAAVRAIKRGLV